MRHAVAFPLPFFFTFVPVSRWMEVFANDVLSINAILRYKLGRYQDITLVHSYKFEGFFLFLPRVDKTFLY